MASEERVPSARDYWDRVEEVFAAALAAEASARTAVLDARCSTRTGLRAEVEALLAAHARGLASYWRTPRLLQSPEGRAAVVLEDDEEFVALIHLGEPVTQPVAKPRKPVGDYVTFLD